MVKKQLRRVASKLPFAKTFKVKLIKVRNALLREWFNHSKIDENLIVFESFMSRGYGCSPRRLYEAMLDDESFDGYHFIWSFRQPHMYKHLENSRTKLVKFGSLQYYEAYAGAKFWVVNGWVPLNVKKRKSQIMLQTWHGAMLKRLRNDILPHNLHATTGYEESVRLGMLDAQRYDYFISTARFFTHKIISAFGLKELGKESIVIETGYPRNDPLFRYTNSDRDTIRKKLSLPKNKKVILYTPTWRDDQHNGKRFTYGSSDVDFHKLQEQLKDQYVVLFRAHYNVVKDIDLKKYEGFIYDVSDYEDINELYVASDVLLTDYSSTFFDYVALDRPVLFFMYDYEHYANKLHGLYLEPKDLPGKVVKTEKGVAEVLEDLDQYTTQYKSRYNAFKKKYAYLDDGNATDRVLKEVFGK